MIQVLDFCEDSIQVWKLIGLIINILKIAIPIIIVLMATIDLGKAVIAGKEDEIKAAQKLLIKRLIYGVLIFFVVTVVQTVISLVSTAGATTTGATGNKCWVCATNPNGTECNGTTTTP